MDSRKKGKEIQDNDCLSFSYRICIGTQFNNTKCIPFFKLQIFVPLDCHYRPILSSARVGSYFELSSLCSASQLSSDLYESFQFFWKSFFIYSQNMISHSFTKFLILSFKLWMLNSFPIFYILFYLILHKVQHFLPLLFELYVFFILCYKLETECNIEKLSSFLTCFCKIIYNKQTVKNDIQFTFLAKFLIKLRSVYF